MAPRGGWEVWSTRVVGAKSGGKTGVAGLGSSIFGAAALVWRNVWHAQARVAWMIWTMGCHDYMSSESVPARVQPVSETISPDHERGRDSGGVENTFLADRSLVDLERDRASLSQVTIHHCVKRWEEW